MQIDLTERTIHRLEDCFEKCLQKVAFELESRIGTKFRPVVSFFGGAHVTELLRGKVYLNSIKKGGTAEIFALYVVKGVCYFTGKCVRLNNKPSGGCTLAFKEEPSQR